MMQRRELFCCGWKTRGHVKKQKSKIHVGAFSPEYTSIFKNSNFTCSDRAQDVQGDSSICHFPLHCFPDSCKGILRFAIFPCTVFLIRARGFFDLLFSLALFLQIVQGDSSICHFPLHCFSKSCKGILRFAVFPCIVSPNRARGFHVYLPQKRPRETAKKT